MSELFLVCGDLSFPAGKVAAWRKCAIGEAEVGRLPKYVSGLQSDTTVKKLLTQLGRVAKHEHVELEVGTTQLRLRALLLDHTLHDVGAPLVGKFHRRWTQQT